MAHSEEILFLLQKLNHSTRAYIYNAKGLKGFLVPLNIGHELFDIAKDGTVCYAKKEYETNFGSILGENENKISNTEKLALLEKRYPYYFVSLMRRRGLSDKYTLRYKKYENDWKFYTLYI